MSNDYNTLSMYDGIPLHHRDEELPFIRDVLREFKPKTIIELGTMWGGFAAFLADESRAWSADVHTFDLSTEYQRDEFRAALSTRHNLNIHLGWDVLGFPRGLIVGLLTRERTLLYCDNGEKEHELTLYAPFVRPGSMIGVHDYDTEVRPQFAHDLLVGNLGMQPFHEQQLAALAMPHISRFWTQP